MSKKTGDIRRAEKLVQKKERQTRKAKRPACGDCEYNQPNFKYRTCLFVRCPMDRTRRMLRDKPLREDKFSA